MSKPTKADCVGCHDDFYNHDGRGLNGVCWNLDGAKLVQLRLIPIDMYPPFDSVEPVTKPSCYRQQRHVTMKVKP